MDTTQEPTDIVQSWQDWYRKHRLVAQTDKPLATKGLRENMHDTTNAVETLTDTDPKAMWIKKAREHFADTLAEYQYELNGKDFYKAFYQAAVEAMDHSEKNINAPKNWLICCVTTTLGKTDVTCQ